MCEYRFSLFVEEHVVLSKKWGNPKFHGLPSGKRLQKTMENHHFIAG